MTPYGYAGNILRVDLSTRRLMPIPTANYSGFLGGRGIAARIYWEEVPPHVGPLDPENRLIFMTGPLAGFTGLASSRWQVCGKSPMTIPERFCYASLGGSWGAQLKFAGCDGIVVQGAAERPVYLLVQDGIAELRDASHLWNRGAAEVRHALKGELGSSVRVVATGPAGDNRVRFATLLADEDASGSGGLGAVMGSKRLKAIAVRGDGQVSAAHPEALRQLTQHLRQLNRRSPGFTRALDASAVTGGALKKRACYGCISGCIRSYFQASDGTRGKMMCQSGAFYQVRAQRYYGEWNEVPFKANRLCDDYGLDTINIETMIIWLARCQRAGILSDENTDLPLSKIGSLDFIESLVKAISARQGFGDVLAQGVVRAAEIVGRGAKEQITDYVSGSGENIFYDPRLYIFAALLHAMEPRQPIQQLHEIGRPVVKWLDWVKGKEGAYMSAAVMRAIGRRFWGGEMAADFSTYEGKALAARIIQDRQHAYESLILCDGSWPILDVESSPDHVGDPSLASAVLTAVTGHEVDEQQLYRMGERVFNLQRAILTREGRGGRKDDLPDFYFTIPIRTALYNPECLVPGAGGEVLSRKGALLDRQKFEEMRGEYYRLRGWDVASGLQTRARLEELGLGDVARELAGAGLVV